MTDREKAIVMAYTGTAMLTGEKFSIFHKYIEDILGRSVWTHELAERSVWEEIEEKSKSDFLELCKNEERPQGEWEVIWHKDIYGRWSNYYEYKCSVCHNSYTDYSSGRKTAFCQFCGATMKGGA